MKDTFEVISLSREDFKARGFNADNVSDEVMEKIASRLADILTEETFWYALDEQATTNKMPTLLRETNAVWKDTKESFVASIIVGVSSETELDNTPYTDDDIFFYCSNEEEYQKLFNEDNGEDFYLIHEDFLVTD